MAMSARISHSPANGTGPLSGLGLEDNGCATAVRRRGQRRRNLFSASANPVEHACPAAVTDTLHTERHATHMAEHPPSRPAINLWLTENPSAAGLRRESENRGLSVIIRNATTYIPCND